MAFLRRINYLGRFTYLFVLVGVVLSFFSIVLFSYHDYEIQNKINLQEAQNLLVIKQELLKHDVKVYANILSTVDKSSDFEEFLGSHSDVSYGRTARLFKSIAMIQPNVMQLRFIDINGHEQIRVDRGNLKSEPFIVSKKELQDKSNRNYFLESMKLSKDNVYVSNLDLNVEYGKIEIPYKPVLRFATPIFKNNKCLGVIIVNVFMQNFLKDITTSSLFNIYIYDQDGYLLSSNDIKYHAWGKYLKENNTFDTQSLLAHTQLKTGSLSEKIYLGLRLKDNRKFAINDYFDSIVILVSVIIPLAFIFAYILAKIPKRLFDELEQREKVMVQQSKMSAIGEMVAAISHQWRQPLNAVGVLAQEIELKCEMDILEKDELKKLNNNLLENLEYMSNTINDFKDFFKPEKEKKVFSVLTAVDDSLKIVSQHLEEHNIDIEIKIHSNIPGDEFSIYNINGFEGEFKQVIINLIQNAKDAISANPDVTNKKILITIQRDAHELSVKVKDTGGGIKKEVIEKIFDLYFSTKDIQQGTGLGLYMSKLIIEQNMQGELKAANKDDGAEFVISLFSV